MIQVQLTSGDGPTMLARRYFIFNVKHNTHSGPYYILGFLANLVACGMLDLIT
jgi:hypothetical protein